MMTPTEFATKIGIGDLNPVTQRIIDGLDGKEYNRVDLFNHNQDLGRWQAENTTMYGNATVNTVIQSCVDRALIVLRKAKSEIEAIDNAKIAIAISWAAKKLEEKQYNTVTQSGSHNIKEAYTQAAESVVQYIQDGGDLDRFDPNGDGLDLRSDTLEDDRENEDGGDPHVSSTYFSKEDFEKYVLRDGVIFDELSRLVDQIPALAITVESGKQKSEDGSIMEFDPLRLDRLNKMTSDGYAVMATDSTYFAMAAINKGLRMKEWYEQTESKRVELIMLDASGSMHDPKRGVRALAYAYNRLDHVAAGRCVVAIAGFGTNTIPFTVNGKWIIDNPKDAIDMKSELYSQYCIFAGGADSTNIPQAVAVGYKMAENMMSQLENISIDGLPHMTVITDDDHSSGNITKPKNLIVNCLAVSNNDGMRKICFETGGVYMPLSAIRSR